MSAAPAPPAPAVAPAFDHRRLDELMERAGLDALLATSKHNVQYLLGGHRYFFFDYMDAIGVSRYLPVVVYVRGRPEATAYIGNATEDWQLDNRPLWVSEVELSSWGAVDAVDRALAHLRRVRPGAVTVGIEPSFLPADAYLRLTQDPEVDVADGYLALERLRARKTPQELALVEQASTAIVDSMVAVFGSHGVGTTKHELVEALRREETARGLIFEYCLVSMGSSANRGASDQAWRRGDVLCLDSGGNLGGYIGDLARMAVLGEPDGELQDLLGHVDETQQAARRPIRPGARGEEIFHAADEVVRRGEFAASTSFVAHGMGLISHEAPRLTATGPVPYPNDHGDQPLEQGMVLSIETTLLHPTRGFIKLEDTVVVTDDGHRAFGDGARGWSVAQC
ncbi:M24 family metallopeptidase [Pseudonocardia benzenivorans]|uniref:Peptidase M24 n=2 Tax=Pseudonocardia TaxID=1847 RepID=F4CPG0_PSEUX|nr:Xaa-Pro peptidase family protein [Pseudonocardia dioxanivorans]AEA24458.1 peptidase M24 [Pseudonocardia dioxanivorans CB1190]